MNTYQVFISLFILSSLCSLSSSSIPSSLFICNQYTCSPANGKCGRDNECICAFGYTTIDDDSFGDFKCNYKQKSQVKAFLLEFLIGFGIGHFYIGNVTLALAKLLYSSFTCFVICQLPSFAKIKSTKRCAYYIQLIFGLGWVMWQIVDSIMIVMNYYKDNNGMKLREW